MDAPAYDIGDIAYLSESARMGFLEPVRISGVQYGGSWDVDGWIYSVHVGPAQPAATSTFSGGLMTVGGKVLLFAESELIDECEALELVEANLERQLNIVRSRKEAICQTTS